MRASEFVTELVSRADKLDHFKNRIAVAAKLCEKLGDQPLVYRAFSHNNAMTLLAKIDNSDIKNPQARKGGVGAKNQMAILQQLEIQYPVFCRMTPPSSARGFHGLESIFIPIGDVTPYWSPRIRDLGGIDYVRDSGEYHQSHVPVPGMPGVTRGNPGELDQTERWVKTYQHAWPNATTDHELIFDCASYYLLDMEVFFTKFAGKELKGMIDTKSRSSWKPINPEAFNKLKTYSNVAWYLNNTAMSYLNWWETKNLEKPVDANRNTQNFEEGKKKRRVRAAYGPGLYGGYGYYAGYSGDMGGGDGGGESVHRENMDHSKDDQAVPELKAALVGHKKEIQSASDDKVYDIIDKMMARIAKAHGISGQKLHDMWVEKYGQIPDTWIMKISETLVSEDAMMGKIEQSGKIVRILKKQHSVPFSDEKEWLLIDTDPAKGNKGLGLKWIPADTRFEWVRPYRDTVEENFADGKNPQDKGDSKRHGINTKASVSSLRKTAKQGGRKGQLAHWLANMKAGQAKKH